MSDNKSTPSQLTITQSIRDMGAMVVRADQGAPGSDDNRQAKILSLQRVLRQSVQIPDTSEKSRNADIRLDQLVRNA